MRQHLLKALRNWAAHNDFKRPQGYTVKYLNDSVGGCVIEVKNPTGYRTTYVLSVTEKRRRY